VAGAYGRIDILAKNAFVLKFSLTRKRRKVW